MSTLSITDLHASVTTEAASTASSSACAAVR